MKSYRILYNNFKYKAQINFRFLFIFPCWITLQHFIDDFTNLKENSYFNTYKEAEKEAILILNKIK